jgi:hypothetical protein
MNRVQLKPPSQDLITGDAHLSEMIKYIRRLIISVSDPEAAAMNAATAYLALITAFSDENVIEVAWAPCLVVELDSQEYEVCKPKLTAPRLSCN